ncbi:MULTISPECIES: hypothetical protein [unclassified Cupriavidus]|uniref:COG4648 family protein n=1 Tax=unclassified Cupriavidus TaxID=2640874 RepID=UPI000291A29A|nr:MULTISPECIES: hypothetical protein [unclassified Cupriavidus]ESH93684.1 membrane protein [Cupriavidus sp. HPC(L)]MCD9120391.1 hypothetical protein [Cupriavidus sp. UGS-1]
MAPGTGWRVPPRMLLAGAATLLYPLIVYAGLRHASPRVAAFALVGVALLRASTLRGKPAWIAMAAAALLLAVAVFLSGETLPLKLYPALVNGVMLAVFGWSLLHPPTLVERIARLREPELPPSGVAYTRRVTIAWCLFFVFNGALALATAWWASDAVWALYNGGIAYVLIALMFAGEWLVRRRVLARKHDE